MLFESRFLITTLLRTPEAASKSDRKLGFERKFRFWEPGGVWRTNSGSRPMPCTGPWFPTESELAGAIPTRVRVLCDANNIQTNHKHCHTTPHGVSSRFPTFPGAQSAKIMDFHRNPLKKTVCRAGVG